MFIVLYCFVFFFWFEKVVSVVVVVINTKTFLKTKLIFVKLRFLAGKIQRSLKENFINVSKISVICSLRLSKNLYWYDHNTGETGALLY